MLGSNGLQPGADGGDRRVSSILASDVSSEHWLAAGVALNGCLCQGHGGFLHEQVFQFAEPQTVAVKASRAAELLYDLKSPVRGVASHIAGTEFGGVSL